MVRRQHVSWNHHGLLHGSRFQRTGKRSDIFLATKFGYTASDPRGDPEYVKQQATKSLSKLGVDYIDLYYQHRCVRVL